MNLRYSILFLFILFLSYNSTGFGIPNERSLIPGTPSSEIRSDGGSLGPRNKHPTGFGWEHYSVKTPLAWEISKGRPSIVHHVRDNFEGISVDYIPYVNPGSLIPHDIEVKSSLSETGNWLYFYLDPLNQTDHNLGDTDDPFQMWYDLKFKKPVIAGSGSNELHGTDVLGMTISRIDNDNMQLPSNGTPMGAKIGSCPECSGVATSSRGMEYQLDIDMEYGNGITILDSRSHSTSGSDADNMKDNMKHGIIELVGGGNEIKNSTHLFPPDNNVYRPRVYFNGNAIVPHATDPAKDVKVITVGGLSNGETGCHPINKVFSGIEEFPRNPSYNYSVDTDKFHIPTDPNATPQDRANIRGQAQIDVVAPARDLLMYQLSNPQRGYRIGHGTSHATPFVAGIVDLMLSVNKRMGIPIDANGNPAQPTVDGLDVQRRAYDIVTFTATKVIDDGVVDPPNGGFPIQVPIQPEYLEQANDKLKRWWAQRMGFGKVNAYRAVAHSIRNETPYSINSSYTLPFSSGGSDPRGYVNPDGNQLMHMGAWADDGTNTLYETNISRGPTANDDSPWKVLEYGGASNPTDPQAYNNHGVTLLDDNTRIELIVNASGSLDRILAIDGSVIGLQPTANHTISTDIQNNKGLILAEGYIKDVELKGKMRIGDLDVDASSNGTGRISFGGNSNIDAEVYGKVTSYNYGQIRGNGGTLILRPGSALRAAGNKDIHISNDSEWHMKGASRISAVSISYDADDFEIETDNNNVLHVEAGSKLYIDENQKTELNIEVNVHPCAELIIEKDAVVRIKKLNVQVGGTLTVKSGAMLILEDTDHYLLGTNNFTGTPNQINLYAKTSRNICVYKETSTGSNTANIHVCNGGFNYPTSEVKLNSITQVPYTCGTPCPSDFKIIQTTDDSENCCFKVQFRLYNTCSASTVSSVEIITDEINGQQGSYTFDLTGENGLYITDEICPIEQLEGVNEDIHLSFYDGNNNLMCQESLDFSCTSCCSLPGEPNVTYYNSPEGNDCCVNITIDMNAALNDGCITSAELDPILSTANVSVFNLDPITGILTIDACKSLAGDIIEIIYVDNEGEEVCRKTVKSDCPTDCCSLLQIENLFYDQVPNPSNPFGIPCCQVNFDVTFGNDENECLNSVQFKRRVKMLSMTNPPMYEIIEVDLDNSFITIGSNSINISGCFDDGGFSTLGINIYIDGILCETVYFANYCNQIILPKEGHNQDGIETIKLGLNVIPNPVTDQARFEFNTAQQTQTVVEIYDLQGQKVSTVYHGLSSEGPNSYSFSTSSLSTGTYLIKLNLDGSIYSYQFIKE